MIREGRESVREVAGLRGRMVKASLLSPGQGPLLGFSGPLFRMIPKDREACLWSICLAATMAGV